MKLAVIGANGRSGRAFTGAASAAGHSIRAGARNQLPEDGENIEYVWCDATNYDDLRQLIAGQDAVVSLIGHIKNSPEDVQTQATQQTIKAMRDENISRFISLTGNGVRMPGDTITPLDRLMDLGIKLADPARVRDGKNFVAKLQQSDLDWTVLRVLKLQNIRPRPYALLSNGPAKWVVGRREVAQAILEVLEDNSFRGQAPMIGRRRG